MRRIKVSSQVMDALGACALRDTARQFISRSNTPGELVLDDRTYQILMEMRHPEETVSQMILRLLNES